MKHGIGKPPKKNTLKQYDLRQKTLKNEDNFQLPFLNAGVGYISYLTYNFTGEHIFPTL